METHIEAACALTRSGLRKATARGLADAAARACLAQAGRQPGEVDMLINVDPDAGSHGAAGPRPAGGAILLGWDDNIAGFTDFHFETFPEYADLYTAGLMWQGRRGIRFPRQGAGRHELVIDEKPGYQARLADCAEEATRNFLRQLGMDMAEVDLLVPAPSAPGFLDPLRERLGVPGDRVAYTPEDLEGTHTTGPITALQAAIRSGRLGEAGNTLMLAAGSGITVALALYRQTPA
jgi:3-oxoacyl-[acyl-carrier-protein] synthase III